MNTAHWTAGTVARPCGCPRHNLRAAGHEATAMSAGFGMAPAPVCTQPRQPNNPDCTRFWREVDV